MMIFHAQAPHHGDQSGWMAGTTPIAMMTDWYVTRNSGQLDREYFAAKLAEIAQRHLVIDDLPATHGWETNAFRQGRDAARAARGKWMEVLQFIREVRPDLHVGVYRMWPVREFRVMRFDADQRQQWRDANTLLLRTRNVETGRWDADDPATLTHLTCPTLYDYEAHEQDQGGQAWRDFADAHITEARRFNRNVTAFLSARYHPSSLDHANELIPPDRLDMQMEHCRSHGVDVALWTGSADLQTFGFQPFIDAYGDKWRIGGRA